MYISADPISDIQLRHPKGYCRKCFAELYEYDDDDLCPVCMEELEDG